MRKGRSAESRFDEFVVSLYRHIKVVMKVVLWYRVSLGTDTSRLRAPTLVCISLSDYVAFILWRRVEYPSGCDPKYNLLFGGHEVVIISLYFIEPRYLSLLR